MTTTSGQPGRYDADAMISVTNYSFWYGDNQALHDVNMDLPKNRITALIGPSGCGKSTLLRSINRMNDLIPNHRHRGDIAVSGKSVFSAALDATALRLKVGMVFQQPNPFPKSIYDNVAYGPRINALCDRSELDERVESALKQAALWDEVKDRLDSFGNQLSGGQQQRLCIARALANRPDVLLLDEPCSALDPIATQSIEELLVRLKTHYTIVIVTHNLQQAARVADGTAFFYLGKLIEYDHSATMFTQPSKEQTESYITGRFG